MQDWKMQDQKCRIGKRGILKYGLRWSNIYTIIHQTGSKKITKQTSTVIKKQRKLNVYENLTKYYRLLQNLQKQFTVEL